MQKGGISLVLNISLSFEQLGSFVKMDNYRLEIELGEGAFGKVYKAKDIRTGEVVAIKAIEDFNPTTSDHEVLVLKGINHDQIIKCIGSFYSNDGWLGVVMEFADQGTLEDLRPSKEGFWSYLTHRIWGDEGGKEYNVWRLLAQIAEPLNFLHTLKPVPILHRDLKPANIMFKSVWNRQKKHHDLGLKIADYGMASLLSKKAESSYYATTCAATPVYMAPEVLQNVEAYAFTADIWSFGAVVYFFISCQHLFSSKDQVEKWNKKTPIGNPYSYELKDLVAKMLDPDARGRPTAEEILVETGKNNRQSKNPRKYLKL